MERARHAIQLLFLAGFCAVIGVPGLTALVSPLEVTAEAEKRQLAPMPGAPRSAAELAAFPRRFEAFYSDHFGLRGALIHANSRFRVGLLGVSTKASVDLGKDGWLFYAGVAMLAHRGVRHLSEHDLVLWQRLLEGRRDWLAERGIRYLFVVAPDKQSIYPEQVAERQNRLGPTPLDRLVAHLRAHSDLEIVDLRPTLLAAKGAGLLYRPSDSHWNGLGAYHGYREILHRLGKWFPDLAPLPLEAFQVERSPAEGGNLAQFLGVRELFRDEHTALVPRRPRCAERTELPLEAPLPWARHERPFRTTCADAPPRTAVVFRDSFGNDLVPLLAEHFSRAAFVWQVSNGHPMRDSIPGLMEQVVARDGRPDVVIDEMVERKLMLSFQIPPELLAATARRQFDLAAERRLALGPAGVSDGLVPLQQAGLRGGPAGALVRVIGTEPALRLAPLAPAAGGWPVVRIRLFSPAATRLRLFYRSGPAGAEERLALSAPLVAGENEVHLELVGREPVSLVVLQPGEVPGIYRVESIEVRQRRFGTFPGPPRLAGG